MYYLACIAHEDGTRLIAFPDAPGCQTFASADEDLVAVAREALEGWLESHLELGNAPPRPSAEPARVPGMGCAETIPIDVSPRLSMAVQLRWARQDAGLSQAQFAQRLGVSRQQVSLLESPEGNPTLGTLEKVAHALHRRLDIALVA